MAYFIMMENLCLNYIKSRFNIRIFILGLLILIKTMSDNTLEYKVIALIYLSKK